MLPKFEEEKKFHMATISIHEYIFWSSWRLFALSQKPFKPQDDLMYLVTLCSNSFPLFFQVLHIDKTSDRRYIIMRFAYHAVVRLFSR